MNNLEIKHKMCEKQLDKVYNKLEELEKLNDSIKCEMEEVYHNLEEVFDEQDLAQSNLFEYIDELEKECYNRLRPTQIDLKDVVDNLIQYKKELEILC